MRKHQSTFISKMSFDVCGSKKFGEENTIVTPRSSFQDINYMMGEININSWYQTAMRFEKFRIETFKGWPIPYIDVRELAKNGFFYYGFKDVVKCHFCHVNLNNWEADDVIPYEHLKYSPDCPFVKGEATDNFPLIKMKNAPQQNK